MSGYRSVNFYDLCRLCSSAAENKNVQIYSNDGLLRKINECLPITLNEKDKLPKIICSSCQEYVEIFSEFRKSCSNAQKMLESCLNSTKLRNGGQVYIKDEAPVKKVLKPIQNPSPTKIIPNINIIATTPTKSVKKNVLAPNQPDFLSSIMQAVGIQTGEEVTENNVTLSQPNSQQQAPTIQSLPQYTLTLDGNTLKTGQIQYKIENAGNILAHSPIITAKNLQDIQNQQMTLNQVDEFLKLKQKPSLIVKKDTGVNQTNSSDEPKDKKPKFNLILQTTPQKQQPQKVQQSQILTTNPTKTTFSTPNKAQILNIEKILPVVNQTTPKQVVVPIIVRSDGTRLSADAATELSIQALNLTAAKQAVENKTPVQQKPFAYMQMKVQSNADGQLTFTPAATTAPQQIQLSLSPQQLQQLSFQASQQQQHAITLQTPQLTIPTQQSSQQSQQIVQDTQTQTTQQMSESSERADNQEDEIYDTFDNDYYPSEENEANLDDSEEKLSNDIEKKPSTSTKKTVKTLKSVKVKTKVEASSAAEPPINPEHSEMAKKQLNQLTNYSNKRMENEASSKSSDINLTVCDVCKKIFKRKEFLMQHLKSHIGLRPFKCDDPQCNKSFSRKEHLLRHISSHTGKKEFTCNICNKLFSRKDNLNKHRRIHPDAGQNSRHKSQVIKNESSCEDEKIATNENVKEVKTKTIVKKVKVKTEKKEEQPVKSVTIPTNQIIQQQQQQATTQQPKIIQVLQPQQSQQIGLKTENNQQQIILSMSQAQAMLSQQSKALYTIPTNFILNPHGTFMTATSTGNDIVGNLKFETH